MKEERRMYFQFFSESIKDGEQIIINRESAHKKCESQRGFF